MKLRGPRTLLGLILSGLALTTVPLLVALGFAGWWLGQLANDSGAVLEQMATATRENGIVSNLLADLRRSARYSLLLEEQRDERLQDFSRNRSNLITSVVKLENLAASEATKSKLHELLVGVNTLETELRSNPPAIDGEDVDERFTAMIDSADEITDTLNSHINEEFEELQIETTNTQKLLVWTAATLVPLAIAMLILFLFLVVRPMRHIDRAIRELGDGDYGHQIRISGPNDLEKLGERLEWMRHRLIESTEEKNRFLRHMSHELKTPLANIREGSELLMDGSVGALEHQQEEVADILRLNSIKLQTLIENLLTFSAWQTKTTKVDFTTFELKPLVFAVVSQHRLAISNRHIKLKLRVEPATVYADEGKVRLVIENLISNALKFTPEGGAISVAAMQEGDELVIDVSDTGPGVAADDRVRIFEAFYQGKRPQGGPVGGTGIGLSIVAECVQAHGGTVVLRDNEGSGAHFHVRLPLSRPEQAEVAAAHA